MRQSRIKRYLTREAVEIRMQEADSLGQFKRWQVILLKMNNREMSGDEVARVCGVSCNTVYQWVTMYNKYGPKEYELKGRGGRRTGLLSYTKEKELLQTLIERVKSGQVVTAKVVKDKVEKLLEKKVSKDYAYDLFHRHNWRKVKQRPHHLKGNVEVQETSKKISKTYWLPPEKQ